MSSIDIQARIGPALVNYAADSTFPDEEFVAAANIEDSALPGALQSLNKAKDELAVCSSLIVTGTACSNRLCYRSKFAK